MRTEFLCLLLLTAGCRSLPAEGVVQGGGSHYLHDYPAENADGSVNVVVEIPAGTTAKWEVHKGDGNLRWEMRDGAPRRVEYLGYPGNYGMVPRTLLSVADGGDGDPLDVIVLGSALKRGAVVRVRVIAVLQLLDGGEQDDKLVAVLEDSVFGTCMDLPDLENDFEGATSILETWFENYKGRGVLESRGFAGRARAMEILRLAREAYDDPEEIAG